ncbi:9497_t:CDS:1, partial [Gigaspora rosea]
TEFDNEPETVNNKMTFLLVPINPIENSNINPELELENMLIVLVRNLNEE